MRSRVRDRQNVWFSVITEQTTRIDTVEVYSKPIKKSVTVSATSGTPEEISAGIVPTYDRYITCYDRDFAKDVIEGMVLWVDIVPELDSEGNLVMDDDGYTPKVPPDYRLVRKMDTAKGIVARFGIAKVGDSDE